MAALLVAIAVMGVLMSAILPAWKTLVQREREEELVFRGEQYARAVGLFQRKFAGAFPPSVDVLVQQKFLRRAYKDPVTGERLPDSVSEHRDDDPRPGTGAWRRAARGGGPRLRRGRARWPKRQASRRRRRGPGPGSPEVPPRRQDRAGGSSA